LIVALTTDELSASSKGKSPVIPWAERAAIVNALECVDEIMPQHSMDRYGVWESRRFDVTFVGGDWAGSDLWAEYEKNFAKVGVDVVYLSYMGTTSSTLLRAALKELVGVGAGARGFSVSAAARQTPQSL
jgi:glycerol-3-phosphate cytidylyltransferase